MVSPGAACQAGDGAHHCAHSPRRAAQLLSTEHCWDRAANNTATAPKWEDCLSAQDSSFSLFEQGNSLSGEEHREAGVSRRRGAVPVTVSLGEEEQCLSRQCSFAHGLKCNLFQHCSSLFLGRSHNELQFQLEPCYDQSLPRSGTTM